MTAPQTETRSAPAAPPHSPSSYPPPLPAEPLAAPEPPTKNELVRRQLGTLALLFLLTAVTLGVTSSSMDVFWSTLRFFLVLYTLLAWVAWLLNWRSD